jgi:hypothetical protein
MARILSRVGASAKPGAIQGPKYILLEIPAIDGTSDIVGYLPDSALEFGSLLGASHGEFLFK